MLKLLFACRWMDMLPEHRSFKYATEEPDCDDSLQIPNHSMAALDNLEVCIYI